jgi:hypothetical protein
MIEGLKVTIAGTELVTLCESRAKYHDSRAGFYAAQKEALPDIDENVPTFSNVSKRPQDMMQERIASHNAEAAELRFLAAHIKTDESYLLGREDLSKLGIVQRGY